MVHRDDIFQSSVFDEQGRPEPDRLTEYREPDLAQVIPAPTATTGPVFTVTQLATMEKCALEYYQRYVLKDFPPPSPAMEAGTRFHKHLENYFLQGVEPDVAIIDEKDALNWDNFYGSRFYQLTARHIEHKLVSSFGSFSIKGRIDAILETDGGIELVDWKTGKPKSEKAADCELQLPLYAWMYQRATDFDPNKVSYAYYYVTGDKDRRFQLSMAKISELAYRLSNIFGLIQGEEWGHHRCGWCFACKPQNHAYLRPMPY